MQLNSTATTFEIYELDFSLFPNPLAVVAAYDSFDCIQLKFTRARIFVAIFLIQNACDWVFESQKYFFIYNNNIWHLHSLSVDEIQSYV